MIKNADGVWENTELENQEVTNATAITKLQVDAEATNSMVDFLAMNAII